MRCLETLIFLYSSIMPQDYYYVLSPKHCIVVIGMNTQRAAARRAEEEMTNVGGD